MENLENLLEVLNKKTELLKNKENMNEEEIEILYEELSNIMSFMMADMNKVLKETTDAN